MGRTVQKGCALALACGLLLGACGGDDDDEPTAGDDPTEATEGTVEPAATDEEATTTTATATTDAPAEDVVATIDGETGTIEGSLAKGERARHQVHVPDGVTATVTVTPIDDIDIVVAIGVDTYDAGLHGDPEVLTVNGPIDETFEIHEFYGSAVGGYRITVTSRPS